MKIIGLTGSIGTGKSMAASILQRMGVPVHDADAAVHALLSPGGKACEMVGETFPFNTYRGLYGRQGELNRGALGELVFRDAEKRRLLESILHPLVRQSQHEFIHHWRKLRVPMIVLDIPLLYETGADAQCDAVIVMHAPAHIQRARVLARPNMTQDKYRAILSRQMPQPEKRRRADYSVPSGLGRAETYRRLKSILAKIRRELDTIQPEPPKSRYARYKEQTS